MVRFTVLYFTLSCIAMTVYGQYKIKQWKTTIKNPGNKNHDIPLIVHYPETKGVYPLMVFNHGGAAQNTWYNFVWENLVPQGIIVAMPNDYTYASPNSISAESTLELYSQDQRYVLDWFKDDCNTSNSCPLQGMIGDKTIASGHSDGASCTILSFSGYIEKYQKFKHQFDSAFTLSSCSQTPVVQAYPMITKPIFVMSATHDCMCPAKHDSIPEYNSMANTTCKFLGDITNGTHCDFMDAPAINQQGCRDLDQCAGVNHKYDISQQAQLNIVNGYMNMFINATLRGDSAVFNQIYTKLQSDKSKGVMSVVDSTTANGRCA
eukprot:517118_1